MKDRAKMANTMKLIQIRLITLITIITFLWSGLFINLLQLLNYLLVRPCHFKLYCDINYYLMYSSWSQIVACFDWFFNAKFTIYYSDKQLQHMGMFDQHSIFLANHGYELDWVGAWLVTDKLQHLAACKAMLKKDLKYIPVVGWTWALSDQIFLDRNWEKDKHGLSGYVDVLLKYNPMVCTFFCEGARFTKDRLESSLQFAKERNMVAPKYHLIPRTKGFVAVMTHLKQRLRERKQEGQVNIYDVQVAYESDGALSLGDITKCLQPRGHIYFHKMNINDVPDGDEECAQWLRNLYVKKDEYQEYFNKHKRFPGYVDDRPYKARWSSLFNWTFWTLFTFVPLIRWIANLYIFYGAFYVSTVLVIFFLIGYFYLNWIMYQADVEKKDVVRVKEA